MSSIKNFYRLPLALVLILICYAPLSAQSLEEQIQDLKAELKQKSGEDKVMALKDIGMKFRSIDYDSAWYYIKLAHTEAK